MVGEPYGTRNGFSKDHFPRGKALPRLFLPTKAEYHSYTFDVVPSKCHESDSDAIMAVPLREFQRPLAH